jgi:hypothetical protein
MNLSNTGGGGRGSDKGSIVGDVILHGKKEYWMKGGQYHYHHGLHAGEALHPSPDCQVLSMQPLCPPLTSRGLPSAPILQASAPHHCLHFPFHFDVASMYAGEVTLEGQLVRVLLRSMAQHGGLFNRDDFLQVCGASRVAIVP